MSKKEVFVVGAVIVDNNEILCAKRGQTKTLAGKWEFPGGKIEENETPEIALKREIQEEMKCTIEVKDKITTTVHEYDFAIVHLTTFYCELIEGTPILTEHEKIKWLNKKELNTLDWAAADIPAIDIIMKR